jgi:hypothetical protein
MQTQPLWGSVPTLPARRFYRGLPVGGRVRAVGFSMPMQFGPHMGMPGSRYTPLQSGATGTRHELDDK